MATGTAMVVVAALSAGVAGAGVVLLVNGSGTTLPSPTAGAAAMAALENRVTRQEEEIRGLRASLDEALQARRLPPPGPGGPGAPGQAPPRPGPGGPDAPDAANPDSLDPAEFEARYRELREKEQEERNRTRAAETEAGLRARLDRNTALGLTEEQKDAVIKIQMERAEKLRALFEEARTAGTPDAFRTASEESAEVRAEARRALEGVLTAEQLTLIEQVDRGGRPGQFGGRGGRAGGRDGGEGGGTGGGGNRRRPAPGGGEAPPR